MENDIGLIITKLLTSSIIKEKCYQSNNMNSKEIELSQNNLSRLIGYCILFKNNSSDAEKYMKINDKNAQIIFIINKIAKILNISNNQIKEVKYKIIDYIFYNFKINGFVFHAGNSKSILKNIKYGLKDHENDKIRQNEILHIEDIYRKYNPNSKYSPLGHAAEDIKSHKTGWFFDGYPVHVTTYANSPQWFEYLCGKSYVYFEAIPENKRKGYANRNYTMSLNAIKWLIISNNMNDKDRKELINFFNMCWHEYKDTKPYLLLIPVKEVGINDNLKIENYYSKSGMQELLEDVIEGKVNNGKNYCSKKYISPQKLSYVDLSPILSRNIEIDKDERNI